MDLNVQGGQSVSLSDNTFARPFSEALVHQVVTAYLAGARAGTKAQKSRSAVSGGGKKPWRQKGTGHARAGTIRSPLWRGGGKTFAATPRDHSQKVNKKMYRAAMQTILSELVRQERLVLVDAFQVESGKTRDFVAKAKELDLTRGVVVVASPDVETMLSARNVPGVAVIDVDGLDPVTLVAADKVVMTVEAAKKIEEWLG